MAKSIDLTLTAQLRAESEGTRDDGYPVEVHVTRPNRSKVHSVRLSAEEQAGVEAAAHASLPVSSPATTLPTTPPGVPIATLAT